MPRRAKKTGELGSCINVVWQLVEDEQVIPGSSTLKKNDVFFTKSNNALYLIRGFRSTPNLMLCSPCQLPCVEKSSRNCSRSCCTFCGVDEFCPNTTDGKRRLIPRLVGFKLLMKGLNCTVNWFKVRVESSEVWVACQERFSLVATWKAFPAGGPPKSRFGSMRSPSREVLRRKDARTLRLPAAVN